MIIKLFVIILLSTELQLKSGNSQLQDFSACFLTLRKLALSVNKLNWNARRSGEGAVSSEGNQVIAFSVLLVLKIFQIAAQPKNDKGLTIIKIENMLYSVFTIQQKQAPNGS